MVVTADAAAGLTTAARERSLVSAPVRVAVVGCGAMTRQNLMPVLSGYERIRVAALVDINAANAQTLADSYTVPRVLTSIDALNRDLVDAVIIATPPALHAPQAVELAGRGLHLFVEKPMVLDLAEGERMLEAAARAGIALSVGLYRRLQPSTRLLRGLVESGVVGMPLAVDVEEGGEYGWPLATLGNLTRRFGGGGVLMDLGSHLLDQLQYVFPGPVRLMSYRDNARGGVETDAIAQLQLSSAGREIPCRLELSRTRELRNGIRVECERGVLELARGEFTRVQIRFRNLAVEDAVTAARPVHIGAQWADEEPPNGYQVFRAEIDDWIDAMTLGADPVLSGRSALPTVRLIEDCYKTATPLVEPWTEEGLRKPARRGTAKRPLPRRVLITGATGFIGCRTAEILAMRDRCEVRGLVHNPSHAARLACLPVEMVAGDINAPGDVIRAMEGCDAVVHCAVGTSWQRREVVRVTVDGTRVVAEAAARAGVERFVHISSMAVHGQVAAPTLDERMPLVDPRTDSYAGDKRRAEDAVQEFIAAGLPAVILRPARVYGPFSRTFITRPLQHLAKNTLVLTGPVDAPASMVYVDNVVGAIVRSLQCDESLVGQAFAISDPVQLSWRDFYQFFADAFGAELRIVHDQANDADLAPATRRLIGRWQDGLTDVVMSPQFRALARKCVETDPIGVWPRKLWEGVPAFRRGVQRALKMEDAVVFRPAPQTVSPDLVFAVEASAVVIDKSRAVLGYEPEIPHSRAMELTLDWVRYSRLFR